MANAHSDYEDSWEWFLESQQFEDLLANAIDTPIDHKLIMGDGMFANHTFGCAFAQRGADCDCVESVEEVTPEEGRALFDSVARRELGISGAEFVRRTSERDIPTDWPHDAVARLEILMPFARNLFAAEVGRAMSRGFDYTALVGGFDEGIHDDDEEGS